MVNARRALDRRILTLSAFAMLSLLADPLTSLVDTAYIARLGEAHLAALALCTTLFAITTSLFSFLATGSAPRIARAISTGAPAQAHGVLTGALTLAVLSGVMWAAVMSLAAPWLLRLLGGSDALVALATPYVHARALGLPAVFVLTTVAGLFHGQSDTRTPLLVAVLVNALNLVLDPLFIFVLDGGLTGAAYATALASTVGAGFALWLAARSSTTALGAPLRIGRLADTWGVVRTGVPLMWRTITMTVMLMWITRSAARLGQTALGAHQVAMQLWLFCALAVDAVAVAAQPLIAGAKATRGPLSVRQTANRLLLWGFAPSTALLVLLWTAAPVWTWVFHLDAGLERAFRSVLPHLALMQPLCGLVFVWDGILMGAEDRRYIALAMTAAAAAGVGWLVLAFAAPPWLGPPSLISVWGAIWAQLVVRGLTAAWRHISPRGPLAPAPASHRS